MRRAFRTRNYSIPSNLDLGAQLRIKLDMASRTTRARKKVLFWDNPLEKARLSIFDILKPWRVNCCPGRLLFRFFFSMACFLLVVLVSAALLLSPEIDADVTSLPTPCPQHARQRDDHGLNAICTPIVFLTFQSRQLVVLL
jgi:hypothetical protein